MSQATLEKLIIFETHFPTYDSDEIRALSVEEVLTPMIKALNTQMKSVMSHIKALKNPDDDVMHILNVVSAMDLMKMHLEFTIAVLESNSEEEVIALKENKFALIRDQYENVKSKKDLSTVPAKYVVAMMHDKVLTELKKVLKKCFKQNKFGETELVNKEENIARIRVIVGRFELCYTSYPVTITFPEDDIIRFEKTAPIWQELHEMVIFKQMVTKQEVHSTSRLFHLGVHLSHIINNNQIRNRKNPYIKAALSLVQEIVYYGFQYAQIETQALLYLLKPDVNEAFKAWNIPEVPWVSKTLALVAPFVAVDRRIFIPRIFPKITRQSIQKEYEDGTINKVVPMDPKDLVAPDLGYDRCAILEELFTESEEKVPVRILSNENLNLEENGTNLFQFMAQKARKLLPFMAPPKEDEEKAIVIHMHGGGFVAMSSATHRIYLTTWVKKLKMVHFSIDYRNAPENKYPAAVDDVWQAYLWITNYATSVLGIKYKKVILVGDSSGATLALSLMYRLIRAGLPVPQGCLLFYPALILDSTVASPSYFESLDDPLLPYSLLKLIIEAYLDPECRRREDPFISPLVACDEFLEKLPPLRIITGSKDPLYDDNWKFLQRLKKLKKDVRMIVHAHLSHGYICHKMLKKYNSFLDEACDMIKELTSIGS